jgi:hypothetical protein
VTPHCSARKYNVSGELANFILRVEVWHCNTDTYFNEICSEKKLVPNYAHIRIPTMTIADKKHTTKPEYYA